MVNLSKVAEHLYPIKIIFMVLIYSLFCFGLMELLIIQNLLNIINLAMLVSASVPFAIFKLLGTKRLLCIGCIIFLFGHIVFSLQLKQFMLNHREVALLLSYVLNIYFLYFLLQYCFVLSTQSFLLYFGIIALIMIGITTETYFVDTVIISTKFGCVGNIWQQLCWLAIGWLLLQRKVFPLLGLALKTFCRIVMIVGGLLIIVSNVLWMINGQPHKIAEDLSSHDAFARQESEQSILDNIPE